MILTDSILLIEPIGFGFNEQTASDNKFQINARVSLANEQFVNFKNALIAAEINVRTYTPQDQNTPDCIYPNNWFSTSPYGQMFVYPMMTENRRLEKRNDLILNLKQDYVNFHDLSFMEQSEYYLEGTGSLVFDHELKIAFACLSQRTSFEALKNWETISSYKTISFNAIDKNGFPIYHTNVILTLTEKFAILCEEAIIPEERKMITDIILSTGRSIINITYDQTLKFCGNCIELLNRNGDHLLIMSEQARKAFTPDQIKIIERSCKIVSSDLSEIEMIGGGGARCMIAELY